MQSSDRLELSAGHRALRAVGIVLLVACGVMVVLGTTILNEWLQGPRFVRYWTWCFVLTLMAIVTAVCDAFWVRSDFKRSKRQLFQEEFSRERFGKDRQS